MPEHDVTGQAAPSMAPAMAHKPRLLDLFCGEGGAAMGYHRAGFDVVGVDIAPMPRYPFEFVQMDALDWQSWPYPFDAIHASPPCQAYSIMRNLPWLRGRAYWDSVPPTREVLRRQNVPWVMENVGGAPLDGIMLCGTMFGLRQTDGGPEYRHRLFESSFFMLAPGHPKHHEAVRPGRMLGDRARRLAGVGNADAWQSSGIDRAGHAKTVEQRGQVMGIDWMSREGLSQAIPPAFTEYIGTQLLRAIEAVA